MKIMESQCTTHRKDGGKNAFRIIFYCHVIELTKISQTICVPLAMIILHLCIQMEIIVMVFFQELIIEMRCRH